MQSRRYPAAQAPDLTSVKHAAKGLPLAQKRGSCTAEAFCGAMNLDPDNAGRDKPFTQKGADYLYDREIVLQGYDPAVDDPGGSGLLACQAAKRLGWCSSYTHAFGLDHTLLALVVRPVMVGVNWYSSMDSPDPDTGICTIADDATVRGGHEFVLDELDVDGQQVGAVNSWGKGYGRDGRFYLSWGVLGRLLAESGDATVPLPA